METKTTELIIEKLLSIENRVSNIETEQKRQISELSKLTQNMDAGFKEIKEEILANREAIHFIGDRVFGNHERRIQALEAK